MKLYTWGNLNFTSTIAADKVVSRTVVVVKMPYLYHTMYESWAQQRACMYAKDAVHEACAGKGMVWQDADAHSLQKRNS